ncbi:S-adenosyl-L-methionine-dependent methyltransferase, partial [Delitschia confertaspora ATCC 74209]
ELHSADFLRVKHIIRHTQTGNIRLRGYRFRRAKYFQQLFDWMLNEVAMLVEVQGRDSKDIKIQGMVDIPLEDVKGLRELILTEKPYPQLSFREIRFPVYSQYKHERKKHIFENGRLVCRWVYTRIINDKGKSYEGSVRKIFARESDKIGRKTGEGNTPQRPITVVSGSGSTESSPSMEFLNHDPTILEQASRLDRKDPDRQYTFGDFFCGVGGTSQGAQDAGLKVRFGLDFDKDACEAYKENFPRTLVFHKDAHLFLSQDPNHIGQNHLYKDDPIRIKDLMGTDIVHLSPPCQYFSPAHTRDGKKDQANYEAIYTVAPILSLLKPRIATLEETPGLLTHRQHSNIFWALLCQLNKAGYNVRYKRANLVEYGLAQPRRRLFIMAARQDVPLPDFPKPTHGEKGSGLLQFHYVWDAFDPLRTANPRQLARDKFHQPQNMKLFTIPKTSYDPTKNFLRGLITTSGGDGYHSSGLRRHTVRENALLQSFPLDYIFVGRPSQAQRQVGNAVPPKVAKTFYQHCIKFLRAFDHGLVGIEDDPSKVD